MPDPPRPPSSCVKLRLLGLQTHAPANVQVLVQARCNDEPRSGIRVRYFRVKEDDAGVGQHLTRRTLLPVHVGVTQKTLVLLDWSNRLRRGPRSRVLLQRLQHIAHLLSIYQPVALAAFDGRPGLQHLQAPTQDNIKLEAALKKLESWPRTHPRSNLYGALAAALDWMENERTRQTGRFVQTTLILITDGRDQAGLVAYAKLLLRATHRQRAGDFLFTVGLGTRTDAAALEELGQSEHFTYRRPAELSGKAVGQLVRRIRRHWGATYLLSYCSPKRGGRHAIEVHLQNLPRSGVSSYFNADRFAGTTCDSRWLLKDCRRLQCGGPAGSSCEGCPIQHLCYRHRCYSPPTTYVRWLIELDRRRRLAGLKRRQRRLNASYRRCLKDQAPLDRRWKEYLDAVRRRRRAGCKVR